MNAHIRNLGPSLTEAYPPFAEKLRQYGALLETDPEAAERVFAEAQTIAKAFYAGREFARGQR